ncbi:restriction endonuclease subunit S [Polluticoccus soli]|uniref:restriction endonuclease subunit S n=1 Tax=Polluticoccus soli TaxID=3034150 RepID=UPI0023E35163|nr:restriction endonuclease subunit S [Flavipsychrobacter sp. JY13-12]
MKNVKLGDCLEKVESIAPQKQYGSDSFDYIDISAVNAETKAVEEVKLCTGETAPSRARQLLNQSDILVSTVRPNLNAVAEVKEEHHLAIGSTGFCVLRPKSTLLNSKYLFYWVQSKVFVDDMVKKATGASYPAVSDTIIKSSEIPLPPLHIQQHIADTLDKADALRRKDQELLKKYDDLAQSIFYDMFGDPVKNEKGWDKTKIGDITEFMTSGSRGWAKYYSDKGEIFLRINNVKNGKLLLDDIAFVIPPNTAEAKRTIVQPGDLLVSITADLGRTAVIPKNLKSAYINQHLALIRLKPKANPYYLSAFLSSSAGQLQFVQADKGGVKAGLNFADIRRIEVLLPPIEIQNEFANILSKLGLLEINQIKELKESDTLFNSLLHRNFS